ncbi:MAG: AAA family ATPase [Candidatus Aenigmatarchaeota archaeon]
MYSENMIISNESVLLENYSPEDILHRDGQKQFLAECIKPASIGRKIRNVFLYGPPGTGKTLIVRWMMSELERSANRIKAVYVNCWSRSTGYAVLAEILQQAEVFVGPRESMLSMIRKFENVTKSPEKKFVVALDEIDQLESPEILYDISRSGVGLVCISNNPHALSNLDNRIKSSLCLESMEFPSYSVDQITDILQQRAKYALVPNTISRDDMHIIARLCNGDARIGLEVLRKAALITETENRKKIATEHIRKAFQDAKLIRQNKNEAKLNNDETKVLDIIKAGRTNAGKIYEQYCKMVKDPVTERALRKYLQKLVKLGLVKYEGEVRWREYFTA